jgi:hypothetical protein
MGHGVMNNNLKELAEAIKESRRKDSWGMMLVASEAVEAMLSYITRTKVMSQEENTEFYALTGIDDEEVD